MSIDSSAEKHQPTEAKGKRKSKPIRQFVRDWVLVIAMLTGVVLYVVYTSVPPLRQLMPWAYSAVTVIQPALIFCMLFLTFCKIDLRRMRLRPWHGWLLLIQCASFVALSVICMCIPHGAVRVTIEGAMLCLICPTATAAAVVTGRLGGSVTDITTYTILINLAVAILIPAFAPLVHPNPDITVFTASLLIMGKVFPLLLLPLVAALLVKWLLPALHRWLASVSWVSFYLWAIALVLAIAVTVRSVVHSTIGLQAMMWLVVISAVACVLQFWLGWRIGARYGERTTAGQAFGQKNTVLVIWMGYTFFTPITAVVGGFYSIWHNIINSWQLYKHNK